MLELQGKNGIAKVYTENIEKKAIGQIIELLNSELTKETQVRVMPDVHSGKGSTIGTTIKLPEDRNKWKVSPNIVGVDVGCGMMSAKIKKGTIIDLQRLDEIAHKYVPTGFNIHSKPLNEKLVKSRIIDKLRMPVNPKHLKDTPGRIQKSLGTLGGGNHFIELTQDEVNDYWLTVHTGSRTVGKNVCEFYQNKAAELLNDTGELDAIIENLKSQGKHKEISSTIANFKKAKRKPDKGMEYLTGSYLDDYINDMLVAQEYAKLNREFIIKSIVEAMKWEVVDQFDSIHNFIDVCKDENGSETGIIRKGATSARDGERLIIPLNMRDGSLICRGKGNEDWNFSAPHGAGRIMSRSKAKEVISFEDYQETMKDVYSSSVVQSTLDEAPMAYKPMKDIIDNIDDTVEIIHHIKPIWNFKAH